MTTVALCTGTDPELEEIARELASSQHMELRVVVRQPHRKAAAFRLALHISVIERTWRDHRRLRSGFLSWSVPLRPQSVAAAPVAAHAAVFFDGHWQRGSSFDRRDFMLLSQPGGYGFGMYVLGEALFNRELARRRYPSAHIQSGVVVPRDDAVMRQLAARFGIEVFVVPC